MTKIDSASIPEAEYIANMLEEFSDLLDALNQMDSEYQKFIPQEGRDILASMNRRDYPAMLARMRVSLKRWQRGYGNRVWDRINEVQDKLLEECGPDAPAVF